jgi:hypothetical protein
MNRSRGYIDVDELQAQTSLEEAAAKCGVTIELKGSGAEQRIDCPFGCDGDHCGRKELAINIENPQKIFQCHAYGCGFRGNMLTLMHGWATGQKPSGGKLKGEEFQRVKKILAGKVSQSVRVVEQAPKPSEPRISSTPPPQQNVPLIDSPEEKVRELNNIDSKFVTDISVTNPAAASYVRRHPCLTAESMQKWKCGYLPNDGGGDKRGWSLRGGMVYGVASETGKILCWVGRDVHHEEKERDFLRLTPAERANKETPAKHRFPKGFHRSIELYGQQASRLNEPGYRDFIREHGLIIVEGFNDVINLDNYGIPALGVMSNRISNLQIEKIALWAKQLAKGRVNLMFDNDGPGIEGGKEALWLLAERQLDVRLAWSPTVSAGRYSEKQPESVSREDLMRIFT